VIGTLTVAMEPAKDNAATRVSFSYVVGGYMRYKVSEIAPAVDKVLGEQFKSMLSPYAPAGTEPPKVDSFKLDIETIEEAVSDEASEVSTANPDEDASVSEPPRTL
jgi:hypothetical protein